MYGTITKQEKKNIIGILKEAKRLIKRGNYSFVCHAVNHAAMDDRESAWRITDLIEEQLEEEDTLEGWLERYHGIGLYFHTYQGDRRSFEKKVRALRILWIDSIIELYKELEEA